MDRIVIKPLTKLHIVGVRYINADYYSGSRIPLVVYSKLRIGLVWFDAHGDFNTVKTTLSGMLGCMPVAVAAGLPHANLLPHRFGYP